MRQVCTAQKKPAILASCLPMRGVYGSLLVKSDALCGGMWPRWERRTTWMGSLNCLKASLIKNQELKADVSTLNATIWAALFPPVTVDNTVKTMVILNASRLLMRIRLETSGLNLRSDQPSGQHVHTFIISCQNSKSPTPPYLLARIPPSSHSCSFNYL